jgi:DNA-binding transcriptional MerR regulator
MRMAASFGIGDLSKESGVKVVTIRYYESIGLMPAPSRSTGNYRRYASSARERLGFIRRCRELGFTLDQIRDLLALASEKSMPCAQVKRIATEHRAAVAEKLAALKRLDRELERLSTSCGGKCVIGDCQIVEALSTSRCRRVV